MFLYIYLLINIFLFISEFPNENRMKLKEEVKSWVKDIAEVLITLAVILIVLRLLLGAHMPVPLVAVVSCSMLHEDDAIGSVSYGLAQVTYPILLDSPCSYGSRVHKNWVYLFSWDNIPGNDSERLLRYLRDDHDIGWVESAEIRKSDDGKTLHIIKDENLVEIMIDEKEEKAILKIRDDRTYYLKVKKEKGKLNIYNWVNWKDWIKQRISGQEIEKEIEKFPLKSGFSVGDMILVITPDGKGTILPFFSETKIGDVIIFNRDKKTSGNEPIIHRVVGIVRVKNWEIQEIKGTLDCKTKQNFEEEFIPYVKNCQKGTERCLYGDFPKESEFEFYITKGDNNEGTDQCTANMLPVTDAQVTARGWIRIPYIGWLKLLLNRILNVFLFFL